MDRFSADLRAERLRHGASIEQLASITKVPTRHLLALEDGRFADLPGGIFRKGILRGYLQAIDVAPAPWMTRFEAVLASLDLPDPVLDLPEVAATVDRAHAVPQKPLPPPPAPASAPYRWSGVAVALVLLLAFGWCVWRFALRGHVVLSSVAPVAPLASVPAISEALHATIPLR